MPEKILIENCSPTLAGIKTANLVSLEYTDPALAAEDIRDMNRLFVCKGLRAVPLAYLKSHVLLYLYRPDKLRQDMTNKLARDILKEYGYSCSNPDTCVAQLARRIRSSSSFPHEIGLFLGYPAADVDGFIRHKDQGCKAVGFWKVYSDVESAQRTFAKYRKFTRIYRDQWKKGKTIEQLMQEMALKLSF